MNTMTITNTAKLGHLFYPGTVVLQVQALPGYGSSVTITGTGNSAESNLNVAFGLVFFGTVANLATGVCSQSAGIPMP
jgi:hypothetical protein